MQSIQPHILMQIYQTPHQLHSFQTHKASKRCLDASEDAIPRDTTSDAILKATTLDAFLTDTSLDAFRTDRSLGAILLIASLHAFHTGTTAHMQLLQPHL
jgi:hypothetical protein